MQFESSLNHTLLPKYSEKLKIKHFTTISSLKVLPNRQQHFPPKVQPALLISKDTSSRDLQISSLRASLTELKIPNPHRRASTSSINSSWLSPINPLFNSLINNSSREKSALSSNNDFLSKRPTSISMVPKTPKIGESIKFNNDAPHALHSFSLHSFSKDTVNLQKFIFGERITAVNDDKNQPAPISLPVSRTAKKSMK